MKPESFNGNESAENNPRRVVTPAAAGVLAGFFSGLILLSPRLISEVREIIDNRYLQYKMFRLTGFLLQDTLLRWLLITGIFTLAGLILSYFLPRRWRDRIGRTILAGSTIRKSINRSALLILALLVGVNVIIALDKYSTSPPGPNIILITIDTLRADRLGCYGHGRNTSPNIDGLARKAVLFHTAITPRAKTSPAIASILTGQYPHTNSVRTNWVPLPKKAITLQEILNDKNYVTSAVVGNYVLKRKHSGLSPGFDSYDDRMLETELNRNLHEKIAGQVNLSAFNWLEENRDKKFFLWLHYQDPHGPYTAPKNLLNSFSHQNNEYIPIDKVPEFQRLPWIEEIDGKVDAAAYRDNYDAEILYCDKAVGGLLARLRDLGLEDDTMIILTADHGESLGEHDYYFGHGKYAYEASSRVPLIVYEPSIIKNPGRIEGQVNLINITPTILDLAEIPIPLGMEGRSLLPMITGEDLSGDENIFLEKENRIKAVRTNDWKYISNIDKSTDELYYLRDDPLETENVALENPRQVEELKSRLHEWMNHNDRIPIGKEHYRKLKKIERKAMRSLGYL